MKDYLAFMKEWAPNENANDALPVNGYANAQMLVDTLERCGDDLSRENLQDKALHIKDKQMPMFVPGVKINISPENHIPWRQAQMARFDGKSWVFFGGIITAPEE